MAEAYFIQAGGDNLFSVIALGIVVLITGYLCLDSIRSKLVESGKEVRSYIDLMYREETERWNERFNELQNLQKATYTATKKNTITLSEQLDELLDRIEILEESNTKALQRLTELHKKSLEGQKNSLSLEINHNKENTKQLIKAIGDTASQTETIELLNRLINQIENSTQIMQSEIQNVKVTVEAPSKDIPYNEEDWNKNSPVVENLTETGWDVDAEIELDARPNDWNEDENSAFEEVDNNWKVTSGQSLSMDWGTDDRNEESIPEWNNEILPLQSEEPIPEVAEAVNDVQTEESQPQIAEIKPLYDDPNKALSADEIAALFASFGQ